MSYIAQLITTKSVIPTPYQARDKLQRDSEEDWIPGQARNDRLYKTMSGVYVS